MSGAMSPLAGIPLQEMAERKRDLVRAMTSGLLSGRYSDGTAYTYRSMPEMKDALNEIDSRLGAAAAATGPLAQQPVRAFRITPFSGWR